jgi:hypothetical protein
MTRGGSPLWPPLVAFGAPLCTVIDCFGQHSSVVAEDRLPVALDKNGPNCLLTRGVPGGDVEKLFCGLLLIAFELMHQGPAAGAEPECRDDVGVTDLGEFMAFLGESPNVKPEFMDLQIPGVAQPHVCALEVASEELLEILPTINHVSRQMVGPGYGRIDQVNGEKLNDEEVVIHPTSAA